MPKTPLQMLLRAQNLLGYRHNGDDVVERFVDKTAANGTDVFRVFDALNDIRNLRTAVGAVRRAGKHAQGVICYTISPEHTMGGDIDMAALLKPQPAYDLVRGINQQCGKAARVHVHGAAPPELRW